MRLLFDVSSTTPTAPPAPSLLRRLTLPKFLLGPLTHLATLENLGLASNAVADPAALQDLPVLRRLDLGGNPTTDLSPLGDISSLVWLALPGEAVGPSADTLGRLTGPRSVWFVETSVVEEER